MLGRDEEGEDLKAWAYECYTQLSEMVVHCRIGKGCDIVANEWSEENERYCEVVFIVVFAKLGVC